MVRLLLTINRHSQRTYCFQLWEPIIDMTHVKDVLIYNYKRWQALIAFPYSIGPKGRIKRPVRDAQPAPKWSCSAGDWGAASTSKKDIRSHGRMSFFASVLTLALLATFSRPPFSSSGYSLIIPREEIQREVCFTRDP